MSDLSISNTNPTSNNTTESVEDRQSGPSSAQPVDTVKPLGQVDADATLSENSSGSRECSRANDTEDLKRNNTHWKDFRAWNYGRMRKLLQNTRGLDFTPKDGEVETDDPFPDGKTASILLGNRHIAVSDFRKEALSHMCEVLTTIADELRKHNTLTVYDLYYRATARIAWIRALGRAKPAAAFDFVSKLGYARVRHWIGHYKDSTYSPRDHMNTVPRRPADYELTQALDSLLHVIGDFWLEEPLQFAAFFTRVENLKTRGPKKYLKGKRKGKRVYAVKSVPSDSVTSALEYVHWLKELSFPRSS